MDIQKKLIKTGRRNFLRTGAITGGVIATGSQVALAAEPEHPSIVATPTAGQGYAETQHVRAYYKRARF